MIPTFLTELLAGVIFCTDEALDHYLPTINAIITGEHVEVSELEPLTLAAYDRLGNYTPDFNQNASEEKAVGIIPIKGIMTRSGGWWSYGADDYAQLIKEANETEAIGAIVLKINCHGSTPEAMVTLGEAIEKSEKPIIAAVDLNAHSGGLYTTIKCKKVFLTHKMAHMGSLGVMAQLVNTDEANKRYGIKRITINADQSEWKNKPVKEAKEGKPELLRQEQLNPWAQFFIDTVKEHRPNLDERVEGITSGRGFFGEDCVKHGFADQIMPFEQIIEYALNFERNEQANSMFN